MNHLMLLYVLIGVIILATIVLLASIKALARSSNQLNSLKIGGASKQSIYIKSYHFLNKYTVTRKYLHKIKTSVEMIDLSDQWTIIRKTMQIACWTFGLSSLLILLVILFNHKAYYILIGCLSIYIIHQQFLKIFVDRLDDKLLIQLEKLLGDVRHYYHVHGMIDEAIYDSIDTSGHEITGHVMKMYEILTSDDTEAQLANYYDLVPNKYFKTFLALSYTVQKFGDQTVDSKSMFLTNLNYLKQEISIELLKRRKLNYLFQSLSIISVTPMFFLSAIEKWAEGNMQELKTYYQGSYGFVVQIALFLLVLLCFELISKIQSRKGYTTVESHLEFKLLKIKPLNHMIHTIIGNQYSKALKIEALIKKTGQKISVECIFLRRYMFAVSGFLLSLFVILYAYQIEKYNLLYKSEDIVADVSLTNQLDETDIASFDREYLLKLDKNNVSYYAIEEDLQDNNVIDKRLVPIHAKRLFNKYIVYKQMYFKWWELLICMTTACIFYYIPYWLLLFRKQIMYLSLEDEVMQFHTIILMLMYIERISVEDLLEWMGVFAVIFKESIEKCLNNFEQGDHKALEQLKTDEPFMPFVRLVENLQAAADKISIKQAFDELKNERAYYQDKRKQDNEMILNKKGTWGKIIAFMPLTTTILFYIITPFIHLSIIQFVDYSNQIKNYL